MGARRVRWRVLAVSSGGCAMKVNLLPKRCSRCGRWLPADNRQFRNGQRRIDGTSALNGPCRNCHNEDNRERYDAKHPDWPVRRELKASGLWQCPCCKQIKPLDEDHFSLGTPGRCRECHRGDSTLRNRRIRERVYDHYGRRCANCGTGDQDILTIDHIGNDGNRHRRELSGGSKKAPSPLMYSWLVRNGLPGGFQTLCHNCNIKKHRAGGAIPAGWRP